MTADALLLNYKAVTLTVTPDPARAAAFVGIEPPLAGVHVDTSVPLAAGPPRACGDWRAELGAQFGDPASIRLTGAFNPVCGEKSWSIAYVDPKGYNARALLGIWYEMGGTLGGTVREGIAPTSAPSFVLSSPPLAEIVRDINKFSNNTMAQQLFLTLALNQRGAPATPQAARDIRHERQQQRLVVQQQRIGADVVRPQRLAVEVGRVLLGHDEAAAVEHCLLYTSPSPRD